MPTPIRPLPDSVSRWISRMWWLRCADAVTAWIAAWAALSLLRGSTPATYDPGMLSLAVLCLGLLRPFRALWRPVSGWVGLAVSRSLRPGDRAWYVRSSEANLVLITARYGARMVIASHSLGGGEDLSVR